MTKFNAAVLHVNPATVNSQTVTMNIARALAQTLDIPLLYNEKTIHDALKRKAFDVLFVKHGMLLYCKYRDLIYDLYEKSKAVINIDNDYAFKIDPRLHKLNGNYSTWTTTPNMVVGEFGAYVNWNRASWRHDLPMDARVLLEVPGFFYHGKWRSTREDSFDRYFLHPSSPVTISSQTKKSVELFKKKYSKVQYVRMHDLLQISTYQASLYIEDNNSHYMFTSLAQRFYECLQVGSAIAVDRDCWKTFKKAGLVLPPEFVVDGHIKSINRFLRKSKEISKQQHKLWYRDHYKDLVKDIKKLSLENFALYIK